MNLYRHCDMNGLISFERAIAQVALDYANGDSADYPVFTLEEYRDHEDLWEIVTAYWEDRAKTVMLDMCGFLPRGFMVNWDPRGHQLKVSPDHAADYELQTDWGGYGLLAPNAYDDEHGGSI
jgi:hypothetical protein